MALCHISIKVLERQASEVDQRLETQTRQVSKTFLQCDVTFSCKLDSISDSIILCLLIRGKMMFA